jgi:hypothetical protein
MERVCKGEKMSHVIGPSVYDSWVLLKNVRLHKEVSTHYPWLSLMHFGTYNGGSGCLRISYRVLNKERNVEYQV